MSSIPPYQPKGFDNPYAAPSAELGAPEPDVEYISDAADLRMEYGQHEASVRALGLLTILGGVLALMAAAFLGMLASSLVDLPMNQDAREVPASFMRGVFGVVAVLAAVFGVLGIAIGIGLRKLQTWARWTDVVLLGLQLALTVLNLILSLLAISLGRMPAYQLVSPAFNLIVTIYLLSLLASGKASVVFSPRYRAAVTERPEMSFSPYLGVKLLLALAWIALVLFGIIIFFAVLRRS